MILSFFFGYPEWAVLSEAKIAERVVRRELFDSFGYGLFDSGNRTT